MILTFCIHEYHFYAAECITLTHSSHGTYKEEDLFYPFILFIAFPSLSVFP